jgi:hypothetical protein
MNVLLVPQNVFFSAPVFAPVQPGEQVSKHTCVAGAQTQKESVCDINV